MDNARLVVGDYNLDLPLDFGIEINKAVADIMDLGNVNSDWSQTFQLPGSAINKKAFTHLFDLNTRIRNTSSTNFTPDFNPNLKASATLYVDEVIQIQGILRLKQINVIDDDSIIFECTLLGRVADLFYSINELLLRDLDFSEFNHTLTTARITESWDTRIQKNGSNYDNFDASGDPTGEGYVYLLIDDGSYVNYYGNTNASQFYPALYKKQIVDKIFEAAGYSYTTDSFFNEAFFRHQVVPCPTGMALSEDDTNDRLFESNSAGQSVTGGNTKILFPNEAFDYSNQWDTSASTFTSAFGQTNDFYVYINMDFTGLTPSASYLVGFLIYKNGVSAGFAGSGFATDGSGNGTVDNTFIFTNVPMNVGDTIEIKFVNLVTSGGSVVSSFSSTVNTSSKFYNFIVTNTWGLNQPVDFAGFFNDETKAADFLKSVFTEFCIFTEPDPDFPTKIFLQPRNEFYTGDVVDWTQKLDISQALEIIPMGALNANPYYFKHADGEDNENKDYQAAYNRVYGDKKYFINNDIVKDEKVIDVIFAPSQLFKDPGFDKVLTYIPLNMDNGTGQLRSLYYAGALSCNSYSIFDSASMTGTATTRTDYPFAAHIDSPTAPTLDLNFGIPLRINLPSGVPYTNNNLFNRFWSNYIQSISDKDSKIVAGWFQLTPADIEKLSFRKLYYFERNYFRLNKIENYNPLMPGVFRCEFLFLTTIPDFVSETGNTGGGGSDGFGDGFPGGMILKMPDNSRFNVQGVTMGRDHGTNGFQQLFVGDQISSGPNNRVNTVLGSQRVAIPDGITHATVIGSNDIEVTASGQVWIQNEQYDLFSPTPGQVPTYNGNKVVWQTPGAASFAVITYNIDSSDSPYTIAESGGFINIFADTSGGNITVNLPTMATFTGVINIKKLGAGNTLTIEPAGSETIDGAANKAVTSDNENTQIVSDGTNAQII